MKIIPLTRGYEVIVDDEDFDYLSQWKWQVRRCKKKFYGYRTIRIEGKIASLGMHRVIAERMGFNIENIQVDHIDGNSLNNRRNNLRLATNRQNSQNRQAKSASGFKGVWQTPNGKWRSRIKIDGKFKFLGHFSTAKDAAIAYDNAAKLYFGEFASTNF